MPSLLHAQLLVETTFHLQKKSFHSYKPLFHSISHQWSETEKEYISPKFQKVSHVGGNLQVATQNVRIKLTQVEYLCHHSATRADFESALETQSYVTQQGTKVSLTHENQNEITLKTNTFCRFHMYHSQLYTWDYLGSGFQRGFWEDTTEHLPWFWLYDSIFLDALIG